MKKEKPEMKPEEGIDLLSVFVVLLKYKKFIILTTLGAALFILSFVSLTMVIPPQLSPLPDIYRASTVIALNQRVYSDILTSIFSPAGSMKTETDLSPSFITFNYGDYLIRLVKSKSILDRLGQEFEIAKKYRSDDKRLGRIRGEILRRLTLDYDEKTLTITLSYDDYDPLFAKRMIDRLVVLLGERVLELKEARSAYQKTLLERKLGEVQAQVNDLETNIKQLQAKYGVIEVTKLSDEKITMLANLRSQLVMKDIEIRIYENSSRIEDPALVQLKAERDNLQKAISELEGGSSSLKNALPSRTLLPEIVLEFSHLQRNMSIQEKIYEILLQEFELTKIKLSLVSEEPAFQILESADLPDTKMGPNRSLLCIAFSFLAFVGTCLAALIFNSVRAKRLSGKA